MLLIQLVLTVQVPALAKDNEALYDICFRTLCPGIKLVLNPVTPTHDIDTCPRSQMSGTRSFVPKHDT